jgi:hypothetical protein
MHTNTNSRKSRKAQGISLPLILFLVFLVVGYYVGSEDTFSTESANENVSESIYYTDSGQFSFPVFLYPF